jgi:hypothetical protein
MGDVIKFGATDMPMARAMDWAINDADRVPLIPSNSNKDHQEVMSWLKTIKQMDRARKALPPREAVPDREKERVKDRDRVAAEDSAAVKEMAVAAEKTAAWAGVLAVAGGTAVVAPGKFDHTP